MSSATDTGRVWSITDTGVFAQWSTRLRFALVHDSKVKNEVQSGESLGMALEKVLCAEARNFFITALEEWRDHAWRLQLKLMKENGVVNNLTKQMEELKRQKEENGEVEKLRKQVDELNKEKEKLQGDFDLAKNAFRAAELGPAGAALNYRALTTKYDKLKEDFDNLRCTLNDEIKWCKDENNRLKEEEKGLKEQLAAAELENKRLKDEKEGLQEKLKEAASKLTEDFQTFMANLTINDRPGHSES